MNFKSLKFQKKWDWILIFVNISIIFKTWKIPNEISAGRFQPNKITKNQTKLQLRSSCANILSIAWVRKLWLFFGLLVVFFFKSSNRSQFIWTAHKLKSADWVKSDWLTGTSLNMVSSWRDNNKKSTCMNLFQKQINRQFAVLIHAMVSSSELWYYQGNGDKNIPMIDNWRINENWSLWSKCFFWGG